MPYGMRELSICIGPKDVVMLNRSGWKEIDHESTTEVSFDDTICLVVKGLCFLDLERGRMKRRSASLAY